MKDLEDKYPDNIVALVFTEKAPELREILKEFLETVPHIKTVITIENSKAVPTPCPTPCYVIPSNDYVSKIMDKILYCDILNAIWVISDDTYYYTWFENNKYYFTKLRIPDESYIAISKEDYENYLLYA